jgi:hypothetical protein
MPETLYIVEHGVSASFFHEMHLTFGLGVHKNSLAFLRLDH